MGKIKDIMHAVTRVPASISIIELASLMKDKNIGSVLVESNGAIVGILTERDILVKLVAKGLDPRRIPASDLMSTVRITIDAESDIVEASKLLREHPCRRLPVTRSGQIIGIVTARDIAKSLPIEIHSLMSPRIARDY